LVLLLLLLLLLPRQESRCEAAAAADPESEAWTTILSRSSVIEDSRMVCKLLQVSRSHAAAVHAQLEGRLSVQLTASSLTRAQQFAAWMQRNSLILQEVRVSLAKADASAWGVSTAAATTAEGTATAISKGLALLAGNIPPPPAAEAAAAPAAAAVTGLRAVKARRACEQRKRPDSITAWRGNPANSPGARNAAADAAKSVERGTGCIPTERSRPGSACRND
jgi:hypothetical protein